MPYAGIFITWGGFIKGRANYFEEMMIYVGMTCHMEWMSCGDIFISMDWFSKGMLPEMCNYSGLHIYKGIISQGLDFCPRVGPSIGV